MEESTATREQVIEVLKSVVDPELFIDIWTLGLIYTVDLEGTALQIKMTFTSMMCPAGPQLVEEVKEKTSAIPGISSVSVEVVFEPLWQPTEELKALLGIG